MASDNTSGGHNGGDPAEIRLPERPRKGKGPFIALGVVLVAALVAITVVLAGGDDSSGPTDTVTVRIGTTEAGSDY